jgi:hypothetical protein
MDLSDAEMQHLAEADRREVDPPIHIDLATWSRAGQLDWGMKERQQWLGRDTRCGRQLPITIEVLARRIEYGSPVAKGGLSRYCLPSSFHPSARWHVALLSAASPAGQSIVADFGQLCSCAGRLSSGQLDASH